MAPLNAYSCTYGATHRTAGARIRGVQKTKKMEIELAEWIFPYVVVQIVTRKKIRSLAHWECPPLAYPLLPFLA